MMTCPAFVRIDVRRFTGAAGALRVALVLALVIAGKDFDLKHAWVISAQRLIDFHLQVAEFAIVNRGDATDQRYFTSTPITPIS